MGGRFTGSAGLAVGRASTRIASSGTEVLGSNLVAAASA